MAKITSEDIVIWVLIAATLGIIIWKLFGSPSDLAVIITIGLFVIGLITTLTKKIYTVENNLTSSIHKLDEKTSLGFMKVKNEISLMQKDINRRLDDIENLIRKNKK